MKLRLTGGGYENLTGQFGLYDFVDGLSTTDIPPKNAYRIASTVGAVWEDGASANNVDLYNLYLNTSPDDIQPIKENQQQEPEKVIDPPKKKSKSKAEPSTSVKTWTKEQLENIADKDGIDGVRKVADELGIQGNSINELIEQILAKNL